MIRLVNLSGPFPGLPLVGLGSFTVQTSIAREKTRPLIPTVVFVAIMAALAATVAHADTRTANADHDTYITSPGIASADGNANYGTKGAMMIAAPTASQPRTEDAIFSFNTATLRSAFDTEYGLGQWTVASATITLKSNVATAGVQPNDASCNVVNAGNFQLSWLSNDTWAANENAITWNNQANYLSPSLQESLGTFHYLANGTSPFTWTLTLNSDFVNDILGGSEVTIFGTPADSTVGYLFNTIAQSNPASLSVSAASVPEPTSLVLLAVGGLGGLGIVKLRRCKKA
jgi:hypothetical protein